MAQAKPRRALHFQDFVLDLTAYELRHRGKPIRLERRPMDLLILLAERRGQLVSREEIVARLWEPGVFVDVDTGLNTAIRKVRQALQDPADSPTFIETISGRGYRFIASIKEETETSSALSSTGPEARVMLAVLPFENPSNDPDQEYFADGLTEETISYLGRIDPEGMGVIARTTSMAYKRTRKTIREIGAELNVNYVLESSVRREQSRVRITSQLIRVKDQTHLWASNFDRELTSVLEIQTELGTAIATHVESQLRPGRLRTLAAPQTLNAEAYDLYLRGRYFWNQLSPPTTRRAIDFYIRATQSAPHYALAWSGLADAYATSPINGDAPPMQVWQKARDAASHAVGAAPDLAETQTSLGFVKFWLDWKWLAAEAAFRKAVALNPSYALGHRMLGIILMHLRRHRESLESAQRARELDPLNAAHQALSSQIAFAAGDYNAAVDLAKRAIAIDPQFWIGYMQLGQAYEQLREPELALEALTDAARLSGGNSKAISLRACILAKQGKSQAAQELLDTLEKASREKFVPPYAAAQVYVGLGQYQRALEFLERAFEVHDVHLAFLTFDPKWDAFRADQRFTALLERCNFVSS
jgi:TolB-like protein/tetratricopeptide (TPR) repeat protein